MTTANSKIQSHVVCLLLIDTMDLLVVFTIYSIDRNSTMNKGGALGCMLMMEGGGTCTVKLWRSYAKGGPSTHVQKGV